ncbi:hypothetical protein ACHWQZ_G003118 [Mnemiopsis leidyi]
MTEGYEPIVNQPEEEDVGIENTEDDGLAENGSIRNDVVRESGCSGDLDETELLGSSAEVENGKSHDFEIKMEELDTEGRFNIFSKITLSWKDVFVSASVAPSLLDRCKKTDKPTSTEILKGVSGLVEPGQFVAIMGASGAGKTTLLNTLASRNSKKLSVSGTIKINGKEMSQSKTKLISAYVQQDDCFIETLTVKEVMMFHANLRMDQNISPKQKQKKVEDILGTLGLTKVQDTLVGLPSGKRRGISGGERKRLSVGTELIMDPPLLFIDEPTSGLDSFMAENVVTFISQLAKANRTILCTIHQPASEIFQLFDRICLVSEGEIAYMGDTTSGLDLFKAAGYPCKSNFNPADHFVFTLAVRPGSEESCKDRCQQIIEHYKSSASYTAMVEKINSISDDAPEVLFKNLSKKQIQPSICSQVAENFKRSLKNIVRNPAYSKARIMQSIVIGLLMGLTFLNTKNDQRAAQNKSGALFNLVVYFTFSSIATQTMSIPQELPVVKREYQNGMYSTLPYFLSKVISEIPYLFGLPFLTMSVCYFMIGFKKTFVGFITNVIAYAGVSWAATGLGWFLAAWTGDSAIAGALMAPIIMPFFLIGGFYQNDESTPVFFEPVKYISWFRYGFSMIMTSEFTDAQISCESEINQCDFLNGTDVLARFALNPGEIWWPNMIALLMIGGFFCLFAWTCLLCRIRR